MSVAVINSLPESEWLLIRETERSALAELSEDELLDLHARIRRARTKYVTNYRRGGGARVAKAGGRGKAYGQNTRARDRAEVFEDALARVSTALSTAARRSAADLKAERIAAARATKASGDAKPAARGKPAAKATAGKRAAKRDLVTPVSRKKTASTRAAGARRQAKRDSRNS